ncbi:SpoIIE family protein phosphatase [Microtetraspora sp. NBRC 13810]|uniref:PP2C family protein-serine/threonine phosphatase n=1 Tax=Microtetraspora sp. NBRC 13810 TaxID=3030990 RepID=UPI00255621E3|nr:SpoIIE family protein phosphatase [Microtetraspora sp. NBRC 13810]
MGGYQPSLPPLNDRTAVPPPPMTAAEMVQRLTQGPDRRHPAGRASELLAHAQRLGNMGWAEWDLRTGDAFWSDHLYVIFGRSLPQGPIRLTDLPAYVEPADLPILERLLWDVHEGRDPVHAEFRIRRAGEGAGAPVSEVRYLLAVLEPVPGESGPAAVHGLIQDITDRRAAEQIASESRRQLLEVREQAAVDRHVTLALRDAILPAPGASIELPRTRVAVRYVPAEKAASLGGDWYEAAPLPDGRVLLAIGDVAGHGLPAVAQMAQLRHALLGLSMTGLSADRLLAWLNDLARHRLDDTTATAVVGHLDPATGEFTWAQAGHLSPILIRDGVAGQLPAPEGVVLGAGEWPYELARVTLREDDVLLLFTDGLVERRRRDLGEGLALTLAATGGLRADDVERGLDRLLESVGGPNPEDDACLLAVTLRH